MPINVTEITSLDQFHQLLSTNYIVIVDTKATWSEPCFFTSSKFDQLALLYREKQILFARFDADEVSVLAQQLGATTFPTFIFFVGGTPAWTMVGPNIQDLEARTREMASEA